jgi:hypothetical protein
VLKILAVACLLTLPTVALAQTQTTCRAYEYAELKDIPKQQLTKLYCEYYDSMVRLTDIAIAYGTGTRGRSQALDSGLRCGEELERIERILRTQHTTPKPECKK